MKRRIVAVAGGGLLAAFVIAVLARVVALVGFSIVLGIARGSER